MNELERRAFGFELRATPEEVATRQVSGYAAIFNTRSSPIWDDWVEVIAPNAFEASLRDGANIVMLWQHRSDCPIASTRAGTLELSQDEKGLPFKSRFGESEMESYWLSKIADGTVREMSFGFIVPEGGDEWDRSTRVRTVNAAQLIEVSPVTWPAYGETSVSARSAFESKLKANPAPVMAREGFPLESQLRLRGRRIANLAVGEPQYGNQRKTAGASPTS